MQSQKCISLKKLNDVLLLSDKFSNDANRQININIYLNRVSCFEGTTANQQTNYTAKYYFSELIHVIFYLYSFNKGSKNIRKWQSSKIY